MPLIRIWTIAIACLASANLGGAARAAPPLEAYGKLPHVALMDLSLSGDRYAFVSAAAASQRLFIVPIDGGKPIIIAIDPGNKIRNLRWVGDDYVLVTISNTISAIGVFTTGAAEIGKVIVVSAKDGSHFTVFDGQSAMAPIVEGEYGFANIGGRWYGYFGAVTYSHSLRATYLGHDYPDLYRVDLNNGLAILAAKGSPGNNIEWLLDADGKVVARSSYFEKTGAWQLDGASGDQPILSGHSLLGGPSMYGFGQSRDTILTEVLEDSKPTYKLVSLTGAPTQEAADSVKIHHVIYDGRTHLWIGEVLGSDVPRIVLFAPERQAKWNGVSKAFAKYDVSLVSWDGDFNRLIVYTDGGDDSGTYWLADLVKHSVESIGQARPDVGAADVGPVSMVTWKAADGLELHGVLTLPPGRPSHALPVVVLPHGGPQARDYPGFDWWAQAFAARGYAVFQPNFRGSSGYGADFVDAGHGQWGRKMQTDISDGLAALAAQGVVDPKRACIVGASYGGYAALAGVTVQHGLYRCAVADAGVADLHQMLRYEDERSGYDASSVSQRYWKQFMGASSASDPSLDAISPAQLAGQADAPILLIHGKDDTVVPIEQSNEMLAALKRAGKPVEMVVMPNEDHWLSRPETRLNMLTASVAFVQKYNPAD